MGFPTKNDHFGVFWGYHHLRKHPFCALLKSLLFNPNFCDPTPQNILQKCDGLVGNLWNVETVSPCSFEAFSLEMDWYQNSLHFLRNPKFYQTIPPAITLIKSLGWQIWTCRLLGKTWDRKHGFTSDSWTSNLKVVHSSVTFFWMNPGRIDSKNHSSWFRAVFFLCEVSFNGKNIRQASVVQRKSTDKSWRPCRIQIQHRIRPPP